MPRNNLPAERRPQPSTVEVARQLRQELSAREDALTALLPVGTDLDRFQELIVSTVVSNPDLLKCQPESIVLAVREAAGYGLEPTGNYGGAWLVPRGGRATFMLSYRGLLELVWRSEKVVSVDCQLVYASDIFSMTLGTNPGISHEPALEERGDVIGGYMVAWLVDAVHPITTWMSRAEIDKVMKSSAGWQRGPWASWYESMALKTVLRNGVRFLPMAVAAKQVLAHEDTLVAEDMRVSTQEVKVSTKARRNQARLKQLRADEETPEAEGLTEEPEPVAEDQPPLPMEDVPSD